jgi:hypothetical protein
VGDLPDLVEAWITRRSRGEQAPDRTRERSLIDEKDDSFHAAFSQAQTLSKLDRRPASITTPKPLAHLVTTQYEFAPRRR